MMARRYHFGVVVSIVLSVAASGPFAMGSNSTTYIAASAERRSSSELAGRWHFVRTRNPLGGADTISIMHTADTSRSDIDFAGLMFSCRESVAQAVIVLLRSFPVRARPRVVFGKPGNEIDFEATIAPPGTAVLIPRDAATLVSGPWRALNDLSIRVKYGQSTIRGIVKVAGLQAAFKVLMASCRAY
jgi:hypothetical protein